MISVFPCLWLDTAYGLSHIQLIPQYPAINGSVTLSVTGIMGKNVKFIWYKGSKAEHQYQILRYIPSENSFILGPQHTSRITAFHNGSLQIKHLQISDGGNYKVMIETSKQDDIYVTLTVYELVRKPVITSSHCPIQEDDSYVLTCVTANADNITWSRQNKSFPDGAIISADARTVTFTNIKYGDAGGYRCEAENRVSKEISDIFTLTVLYISEDTSGGSPYIIAGIVCGAIVTIVLIISVTYLLYRAHVRPLRETQKDQCEMYENTLDLASISNEPTYKDLQYKSENVYNEIIRGNQPTKLPVSLPQQ